MKIDGYRAAQIAQSYGLPAVDGGSAKARKAGQRPDQASLSAEAQELLQARRAVQESPDVRADRVAALRQQIQDGTYRVDEQALARRLRFLLDVADE
jgi:negative regulator of flagellin synthesis FlgM